MLPVPLGIRKASQLSRHAGLLAVPRRAGPLIKQLELKREFQQGWRNRRPGPGSLRCPRQPTGEPSTAADSESGLPVPVRIVLDRFQKAPQLSWCSRCVDVDGRFVPMRATEGLQG